MNCDWVMVVVKVLSIVGICSVVVGAPGFSQTSTPEKPDTVDAHQQAVIVDTVIAAYKKHYLFPDKVGKIETALRERLAAGAYANLALLTDFLAALQQDLQSVNGDHHAYLIPAKTRWPEVFVFDSLTPDEQEKLVRKSEYDNYGFHKLERLEGNVGYIDLRQFCHPRHAESTAMAAMNFLRHCDAIIFDLRQNGGGEGEMGNLLSTYFFKNQVHLNDMVYASRMKQDWTDSHVSGPRMPDVPLYILMSARSFSAAEGFTFGLQNRKRAVVVGEKTRGGSHQIESVYYPELHMIVCVPNCETRNPETGATFEATGIIPDIAVPEAQALDVAYADALRRILDTTTDADKRKALVWLQETLNALDSPVSVEQETLRRYAGKYGMRTVTLEGGQLHYQREGAPKYALIPMSDDTFVIRESRDFRVRFATGSDGRAKDLIGFYADGTTLTYTRTGE